MSDLFTRFLNKIDFTDTCWLWTACCLRDGYGQFRVSSTKKMRAHRFSYEWFVGPIPEGLEIDHLCRTLLCVRPDHLEVVTHIENMRRGIKGDKGLHESIKTHCPKNHEYSVENTYTHGGKRYCKECDKLRKRR